MGEVTFTDNFLNMMGGVSVKFIDYFIYLFIFQSNINNHFLGRHLSCQVQTYLFRLIHIIPKLSFYLENTTAF